MNVCDKMSDKGAWLVLLTVVHLSVRLFYPLMTCPFYDDLPLRPFNANICGNSMWLSGSSRIYVAVEEYLCQ